MKRLILALLFSCAGLVSAADPAGDNISSFTLTNDSAVIAASYIDVITIGKATTGGALVVYNSSWTSNTASPGTETSAIVIASVSLATQGSLFFNNTKVRGLFYTTGTNSSGVSIIYKK